jgi:hypothetical protein
MRRVAWQEDIFTRTQNCLLPFTNKGKFPIQYEESLILVMVKVVGDGMIRRRDMVNQGKCAAG